MLSKKIMAAAIGAMTLLPMAASAVTFDPFNTIVDNGSYNLATGPYFFNASYNNADVADVYDFTFNNFSATDQYTAVSIGTILQSTLSFATTGVTVQWLTGGSSQTVLPGVTSTFQLLTLIAAGASDTLRVSFGNPTQTATGGRGTIDLTVAAVPVPAAGLMLLAGLGGLAALRRRKSV